MDGWIDTCMDGWMDTCMHGWMDGYMHGWMDGWMDALTVLSGFSQRLCSELVTFSQEGRGGLGGGGGGGGGGAKDGPCA